MCSQAVSCIPTASQWPIDFDLWREECVPGVLIWSGHLGPCTFSCLNSYAACDLQKMRNVCCKVLNSRYQSPADSLDDQRDKMLHHVKITRGKYTKKNNETKSLQSRVVLCNSLNVPIQQLDWCRVANFLLAIATINNASSHQQHLSTKPTARRHLLFSFLLCCEASCDYGDRNVPLTNPGLTSRRGYIMESIVKLGLWHKAAHIQSHGTWMACKGKGGKVRTHHIKGGIHKGW